MTREGEGPRRYIGHDLGTGGDKAALVDETGEILASAFEPYDLDHPRPGWAEQDPEDYWRGVCETTKRVVKDAGVDPSEISGVGFAGQLLTLVPLDAGNVPLYRAVSWMDTRATAEARRLARRFGGERVVMAIAGAVPSSKDIVCKLAWFRNHEADIFARTKTFVDATGYLVMRSTGKLSADDTCAGSTGVIKRKTRQWDPLLAKLCGAPLDKLPTITPCADVVGGLTEAAAADLGLVAGTPVIAGTGDVTAAQVGSGALGDGDAHICIGTSGWLMVTTSKAKDIGKHGIFSLPAADPSAYAMIGEMETAAECLDWLVTNVGPGVAPPEGTSAHESLLAQAEATPPGADGLVFLPWMFGERSPVADDKLRGAFVNLALNHGRGHLARAVIEGTGYNLRWLLDIFAAAGHACPTLRSIGGGSRSDFWVQTIADQTGRNIERVARPQDAGAAGVALIVGVGLGHIREYRAIKDLIKVDRTFTPRSEHREVHDRMYAAFRAAHPGAAKVSHMLAPAGE